MRHRVVITGMGAVCSAGNNVTALADHAIAGTPVFSLVTDSRLAYCKVRFVGSIPACKDFDNGPWDKVTHLAEYAAHQALIQSSLSPARLGTRMGTICATCSGPMLSIEHHYQRIVNGNPALTEQELFNKRYFSTARILAGLFGIGGINTTIITACSASTAAIALGSDLIRAGECDAVLAGGADTLAPSTLVGFDGLKAATDTVCAPFSKPAGLNLGEGAGFVIIESETHARARSAPILAEILGFGLSNDAYHCSAPDPAGTGAIAAMQRAMRDAGISPDEIAYVNAHGTGTEANDKTETRALRKVFSSSGTVPPVSSTKSIMGHCLGAAGSLETIATIECRAQGMLPPTAGFSSARESCNLDYIPQQGRLWSTKSVFIKNSFAFGGNNASLLVGPANLRSNPLPDRSTTDDVVITGVGIVCSAGIGTQALCSSAMLNGSSTPLPVPSIDPKSVDRRLDVRGMDRSSFLATIAVRSALIDSGYPEKQSSKADLGFFLQLCNGPSWAESEYLTNLYTHNFHATHINAFPYIVPNSVTGNVCRSLGLTGHNTTLCGDQGAGLSGLLFAMTAIKNGHVSAIISGAVDEISPRIIVDEACVSPLLSAPLSEGAAFFILESAASAKERHASPLATIIGIVNSCDCNAPFSNAEIQEPLVEIIHKVLKKSGISDLDIAGVGCSTHKEKEAINSVFGPSIPVLDMCPKIGYCPAAYPLLNIAGLLHGQAFGRESCGNYFLAVSRSRYGVNTACIIQPTAQKRTA